MDTSKKYIEMCEKAGEIKKAHEWQVGDYSGRGIFQDWVTANNKYGRLWHDIYGSFELEDEIVWLPRQDQLQEMVIKEQGWKLHPRDIKTLLHNICLSIENGLPPFNKAGLYSMEQLWLAFVMKEKYNKIWDGKEWRNTNEN